MSSESKVKAEMLNDFFSTVIPMEKTKRTLLYWTPTSGQTTLPLSDRESMCSVYFVIIDITDIGAELSLSSPMTWRLGGNVRKLTVEAARCWGSSTEQYNSRILSFIINKWIKVGRGVPRRPETRRHPLSAALITGWHGRRSIYPDPFWCKSSWCL